MKQFVIHIILVAVIAGSCNFPVAEKNEEISADSSHRVVLNRVLATKKLRVATDYGYVSYLIYRAIRLGINMNY